MSNKYFQYKWGKDTQPEIRFAEDEQVKLLCSGISFHIIKNLELINNNTKFINIPGKVFPIPYGQAYLHLLMDSIGGYLKLKRLYPDLRIIFFDRGDFQSNAMGASKDLLDIMGAEIISAWTENFMFDEVFMFNLDIIPLPRHNFPMNKEAGYKEETSQEYRNFTNQSIPAIKKLLFPYLKEKKSPQFIYISRKKDNKLMKDSVHEFEREHRYHDEIFDEYLEGQIIKLGYTIIELDSTSLIDQINLFYNAKVVAGIGGTNILNAIFCKKQSDVAQILINKKWDYHYDELIKNAGIENYIDIDVRNFDNQKAIKYILNSLNLLINKHK